MGGASGRAAVRGFDMRLSVSLRSPRQSRDGDDVTWDT